MESILIVNGKEKKRLEDIQWMPAIQTVVFSCVRQRPNKEELLCFNNQSKLSVLGE